MVSASSERSGVFAFHAFNSWKGDWKVSDKSNMFIQIKCPQLVRLYQFALRGKSNGEKVLNWKLEASVKASIWVVLYSTTICLSNEVQCFSPTSSPLALYYKITLIYAEGLNPGLSYF